MKRRIQLLSSALVVLLMAFSILLITIDVSGIPLFYDMQIFYTIDDVRRTMDILMSPSGSISMTELHTLRQQFELFYIIDVLFPIVYASLLGTIAKELRLAWLIPIIIATMVLDYIENIIILLFYAVFDVGIAFYTILHIATILKFSGLFFTVGYMCYCIIQRKRTIKKTP
ncbi:hypothetical protein [Candidatus Xianfuyuplasma coldseepsis]|uniref:Uncharacterized protein n=1 Tax=Candidatus Xianfuyuplasma coldseepsis TaxID=2782163 RepID=A0A7L7KTN3_9MOLU|nr:hypothetical protein [Xianfuyuplasma coldseepsis]QMS85672.1 hypothetical protein G4Z02_07920 [Xianfuyuplasma coldseepsis]